MLLFRKAILLARFFVNFAVLIVYITWLFIDNDLITINYNLFAPHLSACQTIFLHLDR